MIEFQLVAEGLDFPEGPIAMADGSLLVVEIRSGFLSRVLPAGKVERLAHLGGGPNGAALGPDGHCYVANNGGFAWVDRPLRGWFPAGIASDYSGGRIERVDLATGKVERLYEATKEGPLRGPNDLVFDAHGGFWFTDSGKIRGDTMDRGSVCYARADGSSISRAIFPLVQPNGIGLSEDGKTLYVAETMTGRLWKFDIAAPGVISPTSQDTPNGGRMIHSGTRFQAFDSMALDNAGNICLAVPVAEGGPGGIAIIAPSGMLQSFVDVSYALPTNICFGGRDLRKAFVTVSGVGQVFVTEWPRPGMPLNH